MRVFHLERIVDVSGTSGTGRVCEGVIFEDGVCVLHWLDDGGSVSMYKSVEEMERIHGHGGRTKIIYEEITFPKI